MKLNEGIEVAYPDESGHFTELICQGCDIKRLIDSRFFDATFIANTTLAIPDSNFCDECLKALKEK